MADSSHVGFGVKTSGGQEIPVWGSKGEKGDEKKWDGEG
jgi:hypothetical protein